MKIESTTKTYDVDGVEFVISTNHEGDYAVVAGIGDSISLDEEYTEKTLPVRYRRLFELEEGENLGELIKCVEVTHDEFEC